MWVDDSTVVTLLQVSMWVDDSTSLCVNAVNGSHWLSRLKTLKKVKIRQNAHRHAGYEHVQAQLPVTRKSTTRRTGEIETVMSDDDGGGRGRS